MTDGWPRLTRRWSDHPLETFAYQRQFHRVWSVELPVFDGITRRLQLCHDVAAGIHWQNGVIDPVSEEKPGMATLPSGLHEARRIRSDTCQEVTVRHTERQRIGRPVRKSGRTDASWIDVHGLECRVERPVDEVDIGAEAAEDEVPRA